MKKVSKKIAVYTFAMLLFVVLVVVLYQAFFKVDSLKLAKANVSEMGNCFFVDKTNDNAILKVSSGMRENPYNLNGVHNEMKPFTLLIFQTSLNNITEPSFTAQIDDTTYQGVLELNPCDNTYIYDLQTSINNTSKIDVTITINEFEFTFQPINLNQTWGINFDEALDLGLKDMKPIIDSLVAKGKFNGECYAKVISDPSGVLNMYYYYIGIIDVDGNIYSVVLDTANGEKFSK